MNYDVIYGKTWVNICRDCLKQHLWKCIKEIHMHAHTEICKYDFLTALPGLYFYGIRKIKIADTKLNTISSCCSWIPFANKFPYFQLCDSPMYLQEASVCLQGTTMAERETSHTWKSRIMHLELYFCISHKALLDANVCYESQEEHWRREIVPSPYMAKVKGRRWEVKE